MSRVHIELEGVWKSYPRWSGERTLRGMLSRRVPVFVRSSESRWALRDVSFGVARGEGLGVIGANGAGKSTLLRLASGLGRPSSGEIRVPRRTASVLNFDAWFDLTLTGRENAVTALVVNGWRQAEARALFPAVIEFAELEGFADAPMRTYSEGMKLRLAFGVIAQLEADALIVDEVITVGDLRFQRKCMERINEMREGGTTLILASHDLEQISAECDRALWLQAGAVRALGDSASVVAEYREAMYSNTIELTPAPQADGPGELELRRNRLGTQEATIESVRLHGPDGMPAGEIATGKALTVSLELLSRGAPVKDPILGVTINRSSDGVVCYESTTEADGVRVGTVDGPAKVELQFERLDLLPGDYVLDVGIYRSDWEYAYDYHWHAYPLRILGPPLDKGVFRPPHRWKIIH